MRRTRVKVVIFGILLLVAAAIIWSLVYFMPESPANEVQYARVALADARDKKAETYSPKTYRLASSYYDSAMVHWKYQNSRIIFLRDYETVLKFAKLSVDNSLKATEQTTKSSATLKIRLQKTISELNTLVTQISKQFARYPLPSEVRSRIARGKLMLSEGTVAFNNGSYLQANRKIADAEPLLRDSWIDANESLNDYFKSYPTWKKLAEKTISESKQKKTAAIIVDKIAGQCYLYQNGVRTMEFDAELGPKWNSDKKIKGDKATPEGMYHITKKLEGGATKYYKALLINYPDDDDTAQFHNEKKNGSLSASAKIGGLIEIHGSGGKGTDWTDGCVALADSDMTKLYKLVRVGTRVTIVGSLKDLNSVKQNK